MVAAAAASKNFTRVVFSGDSFSRRRNIWDTCVAVAMSARINFTSGRVHL